MDNVTREKWDRASRSLDLMASYGPEWRWRPAKQQLFERMKPDAEILFLALGTGLDIACFPPGLTITAIDISPKMLALAEKRVAAYPGNITPRVMDVHDMSFPPESFDQVFTSCTFCSVPRPVEGLSALRRVMKPGGELFMFEHTGSKYYPFKLMMDAMTLLTRKIGPDMNRTTVANVHAAGFKVLEVNNLFMDVVKTIKAVNPE